MPTIATFTMTVISTVSFRVKTGMVQSEHSKVTTRSPQNEEHRKERLLVTLCHGTCIILPHFQNKDSMLFVLGVQTAQNDCKQILPLLC